MSKINWEEVEKAMNSDRKPFAPAGEYETTLEEVELVYSQNKNTPGLAFKYADTDEYAFPQKYPLVHYFLGENTNWRLYHARQLMMVFGQSKENAQKAVEVIEDKKDFVKEYAEAFKRLAAKHPKVKVVVYYKREGDEYPYGLDLADPSCRLGKTEKADNIVESPIADAEPAEDVSLNDIPF